MAKHKLTPWFDGNVKPVRVGPYERDWNSDPDYKFTQREAMDVWDGHEWRVGLLLDRGAIVAGPVSWNQSKRWRGLAAPSTERRGEQA